MDAANIVALLVAIIAALSAFASQQSSAKVAKQARIEAARIELEHSRVDMEKNAYERARAFDTETISRQNKRIAELTREVRHLNNVVTQLRSRIAHVEHLEETFDDGVDEDPADIDDLGEDLLSKPE